MPASSPISEPGTNLANALGVNSAHSREMLPTATACRLMFERADPAAWSAACMHRSTSVLGRPAREIAPTDHQLFVARGRHLQVLVHKLSPELLTQVVEVGTLPTTASHCVLRMMTPTPLMNLRSTVDYFGSAPGKSGRAAGTLAAAPACAPAGDRTRHETHVGTKLKLAQQYLKSTLRT